MRELEVILDQIKFKYPFTEIRPLVTVRGFKLQVRFSYELTEELLKFRKEETRRRFSKDRHYLRRHAKQSQR